MGFLGAVQFLTRIPIRLGSEEPHRLDKGLGQLTSSATLAVDVTLEAAVGGATVTIDGAGNGGRLLLHYHDTAAATVALSRLLIITVSSPRSS